MNLFICVYVYNYKSKAAIDDLGIQVVGNTVPVIQEVL